MKLKVMGEVLLLTTLDLGPMMFLSQLLLLLVVVGRLPRGRGDYFAGEGNRSTAMIAGYVSSRQFPSDDRSTTGSCPAFSSSCPYYLLP